jgi:hypothetical protein
MVWHDGPDFARLSARAHAEPAEVSHMLAAGLAEADPVAAYAYAALSREGLTPPDAETALRHAAETATDQFLIRVAQALHTLTADDAWAVPIAAVLASNAFWGIRIDAAQALADFTPTPDLIATLGRTAEDEEYLVRYHSANTLLRYAGRGRDLSHYPALFAKLATPREGLPAPEDREKWKAAAAELTRGARTGSGCR